MPDGRVHAVVEGRYDATLWAVGGLVLELLAGEERARWVTWTRTPDAADLAVEYGIVRCSLEVGDLPLPTMEDRTSSLRMQ